jgi:hypothetical protein
VVQHVVSLRRANGFWIHRALLTLPVPLFNLSSSEAEIPTESTALGQNADRTFEINTSCTVVKKSRVLNYCIGTLLAKMDTAA